MAYEVGDILWVMGKERPGLQIYRVVEEVTIRTLDGNTTSYRLQPPVPEGKAKLVALENIDGTIYKTSEDVRKKMLETATTAIDRMIKAAKGSITKYWDKGPEKSSESKNQKILLEENIVELPDGTTAILKTNLEDL